MFRYRVAQVPLESEIELFGVPSFAQSTGASEGKPADPGPSTDPPILLRRETAPPPEPDSWFHHWSWPDGKPWLSLARVAMGYQIRCPDTADFRISADAREVRMRGYDGIPPDTLQHLFLDQVFPRVLSLRGDLVLHAGGGRTDSDGAVLWMGPSGAGKSTLAGAWGTSGRPVLADDFVRLRFEGERVVGVPSYPVLRLWSDMAERLSTSAFPAVAHYTEKRRVDFARAGLPFAAEPAPLRAIYVISPDPAPEVEVAPLPPREGLLAVVQSMFVLDPERRENLLAGFHRLADLAVRVPFFTLRYPRTPDALPALVARLAALP